MKKIIAIILMVFMFLSINCITYAADNNKNIQNKIDEQNKTYQEKMEKIKSKYNTSGYDKALNELSDKQNAKKPALEDFGDNLLNGIIKISLDLRKYIAIAYILIIFIYIILLTFTTKNLKKRKTYITFLIFMSITFLFLLNLPLIILYYQSEATDLSGNKILTNMNLAIDFFKTNSIVFSAILLVYGKSFTLIGKQDLTRMMAGTYLIRISIVSFIILQLAPLVISLIV